MSRRKRMLEDLGQDIREHIKRETQDNIEIERGMPLLVNSDRDGLFLHRVSPPHGELQPHLLSF